MLGIGILELSMSILHHYCFYEIIIVVLLFTSERTEARLPAGCMTSAVDVAVLIDSSADVPAISLRHYKSFAKKIIRAFDVSESTVRPSVLLYGNEVHPVNQLKDVVSESAKEILALQPSLSDDNDVSTLLSKQEIIDLTSVATAAGGRRRLGHALSYVCDDVFAMAQKRLDQFDTRREVPKVIIAISSGLSTDKIPSGLSCFNQDPFGKFHDVTIIGVGIGKKGAKSLEHKNVKTVYNLQEDSEILSKESQISRDLCYAAVHDCPSAYHDLVFLVDGSSQVTSSDFETIKAWISTVANRFQIGTDETRVGLVQFSDTATNQFSLNTYQTIQGIKEDVARMEQVGGSSNPSAAIRYVVDQSFSHSQGARDNIPQILLYLTTGSVENAEDITEILDDLRFSGIVVYAIGVGDIQEDELKEIASRPITHHVKTISSFDQLLSTRSALIRNICLYLHPKRPSSLVDIQFLVHGSTSQSNTELESSQVEAAFISTIMGKWFKEVADSFFIGPSYARVAMTTYGDDVTEEFNLDLNSKANVLQRIDSVKTMVRGSRARTGRALNATFMNLTRQVRNETRQVVVLVTDADSGDDVKSIAEHYRKNGVRILVVGFGTRVNVTHLTEIATTPSDVIFIADEVNGLKQYTSQVATKISDAKEIDCDDIELDIQYVLDGSTSINAANFIKVKEWVKSLTSTFDIGPYTNRIGVNQYSDEPNSEFTLNQYFTKDSVLEAVDDISYKTGGTNIGKALNFTRKHSLTVKAGARPDVEKILMVVTDGDSKDSIGEAADGIHAMKDMQTYAIGVGEVSQEELEKIASKPVEKHTYKVENFDTINLIRKSLLRKICAQGKKIKLICPDAEMDIAILMDSSIGARNKAFISTKALIKNVIKLFKIGLHNANFGLVQYDRDTKTEFALKDHLTSQSLLKAVDGISSSYDVVNEPPSLLGSALLEVRELLHNEEDFGARPNVPKVVLVITATTSEDDLEVPSAAFTQDGIPVFAVSVGSQVDKKQIKQVATLPASNHFFAVNRFRNIQQIERSLSRQICHAVPHGCKDRPVDVMFFSECSSSVKESDFDAVKRLMLNFAQNFDLGTNGLHIGVSSSEVNPATAFAIDDYTGMERLHTAITSLEQCENNVSTTRDVQFITQDFSEENGGRENVQNVAIMIKSDFIQNNDALIEASKKAQESGISVITIGLGDMSISAESTIALSSSATHTMLVGGYDDLSTVTSRLVRQVCKDAQCPVMKRDDKFMKGVDMLDVYGMRDGIVTGVKVKRGIRRKDVAYRVIGRKCNLSVPKSDIMPSRCLYYFTLVTVVSMKESTSSRSNWDILKITNSKGDVELSISCRGKQKVFVVIRQGAADIIFNNSHAQTFFNKKWHQLEIQFGRDHVSMYLDCKKVGSYPLGIPMQRVINDTGNVLIGTYHEDGISPTFTVQDMAVKFHNGDVINRNRNELCCQLKTYKNKRCKRDVGLKPSTESPVVTLPPALLVETTPDILRGENAYDVAYFLDTTTESTQTCTQCPAGPVGPPGPSGTSGEPGVQGNAGPKGDSGGMGLPGFTGEKGEKGGIGPPGPPGALASSAVEGSVIHVPGPKGEKGEVGRNGVNGRQKGINRGVPEQRVRQIAREVLQELIATELPRHIVAYMDSHYGSFTSPERGSPGLPGDRGYPGDKGPMGPPGRTGDPGIRGIQGVSGLRGMPGIFGAKGDKGSNGIGISGPVGPAGVPGRPGEAIHGQPGDRGLRGRRGLTGRPGPRGYQGLQGQTGTCDSSYCYQTVLGFMRNNGQASSLASYSNRKG